MFTRHNAHYAKALSIGCILGIGTAASAELERMADFGHSAWDSSPDGTPDLLFHDVRKDETVVMFLHPTLDRVLAPADLNALGGEFYGPGTIGAVNLIGAPGELTVGDDAGEIHVDDWGTGGSGFAASYTVAGPVVEIEILDGGHGFDSSVLGYFDIDETDTGGSGLDIFYTALSGTPGEVREIRVADGGSGYEPGSQHTVIGYNFVPGGVPVTGTAYADDDGVIDRVDILTRGEGFGDTPSVGFVVPPDQGSGAEFRAFLAGGIDRIFFQPSNPNAGGTGYTRNPVITPIGTGTGFQYRMFRQGEIAEIDIENPGGGYVVAPRLGLDVQGFEQDMDAVLWQDLDPADQPLGDTTGRVVMMSPQGEPMKLYGGGWRAFVGDLDGDFDLDLMWRRPLGASMDSRMKVWLLNGTQVEFAFNIDPPASNWKAWQLADLNGDYKDDLIWWDRLTGDIGIWDFDASAEGFVGDGWIAPNEMDSRRWRPYVPVPAVTGENDRILWRNDSSRRLAVADYAELDPGKVASWLDVIDTDGAVVVPDSGFYPLLAGNLNGDGDKRDLLGYDKSGKRVGIWQMSDRTLLHGGYVAWGGDEVYSREWPRGIVTHGEEGQVSIGASRGGLMSLSTRTSTPLEPTAADLDSLFDMVTELSQADAADQPDLLQDVLDFLGSTPTLVEYLSNPVHAWQAFNTLNPYLRHTIETRVAELVSRETVIDTLNTYAMSEFRIAKDTGTIDDAVPALQPEEEDPAGGGGGGGGSGDGGGSGSNPGSGGSPGGGSGGGGGDGGDDGGSTPGSGGGSGGLPDDFDPNDPTTWPPGVDTFEELLQWLIDNPQ